VLAKTQGYARWPTFPENPQPTFSKQHFKMWVLAHYNEVVARAIQNKTLPLPEGATIVKDNFESANADKPTLISTMSKRGGRWYFVQSTPEGKVVVQDGKPQAGYNLAGCTSCHSQASENDQIYTHEFK
jgi:hypothetical protein